MAMYPGNPWPPLVALIRIKVKVDVDVIFGLPAKQTALM